MRTTCSVRSYQRNRLILGLLLVLILMAGCAAPSVSMPAEEARPATAVPGPALQFTPSPEQTQKTGQSQQGEERARAQVSPAQNTALAIFSTADFVGSGQCAACHAPLTDQAGNDVSMPTHWRSTMMANAAKDPVWQAKVSSEVARNPALQAVIEKKCVTCHMPMAEVQAVVDGDTVAALGDGFFSSAHPLHQAAIEGVSCTVCHQIQDQKLGQMESFSGGYVIDTNTEPPDRLIFGPFQQPVSQMMQASVGFLPVYGEQMTQSELCATCHNLYTPYVDAAGNILGEFPEQTPYTEWQHSSFSASGIGCQECHMPLADGGVVISTVAQGRLTPREPFYQHYFAGGNAFMLNILRDHGAELEVTADPEHFDATAARVRDQVGRRSAALDLTSLAVEGDQLVAQLQVSVTTGHKFPASFPSRRAWLHVTVTDASGAVLFESGQHQPDGRIAGNDADVDPTQYEPHYDVITAADQVQIYEPIMENSDGQVTYTLLRAAGYLKDNRLLPNGFEKTKVPASIAVYGRAVTDDDFTAGGDRITYRVDISEATGPFTFQAEMLYEPLSYQFVQDLLIDDTDLTQRFGAYYDAADKTPLKVASIEPVTVE